MNQIARIVAPETQVITPDNHPQNTLVIDNRDNSINLHELANMIFVGIHLPENHSITILRPQNTLKQTFDYYRAYGYNNEAHGNPLQTPENNDFVYTRALCNLIGPSPESSKLITHIENFSKQAHLDSANEVLKKKNEDGTPVKAPVVGLTATIVTHGGGTNIYDIEEGDIEFQGGVWREKIVHRNIKPERVYQNPAGAISIQRTRNWPESHPACLHFSAKRNMSGSIEERLLQVQWIHGHTTTPLKAKELIKGFSPSSETAHHQSGVIHPS